MNFDNITLYFKNFKNIDPKIILAAAVLGIIILVSGGFFLYQIFKTSPQASPQNLQEEVKQLVLEVGKLIDLPIGEDPTLATVTDVEKLRSQPFFQKAQNGDKVLIYSLAKKAILYRPSDKKIIDVAPINIGTQSGQVASPSPEATARPTPSPTSTPTPSPAPAQ